jgi:hypothetical protein
MHYRKGLALFEKGSIELKIPHFTTTGIIILSSNLPMSIREIQN